MEKALAELPISREIKSALLGECNDLRKVLDMIVAYEKADWQSFSNAAEIAGLPEELPPPFIHLQLSGLPIFSPINECMEQCAGAREPFSQSLPLFLRSKLHPETPGDSCH